MSWTVHFDIDEIGTPKTIVEIAWKVGSTIVVLSFRRLFYFILFYSLEISIFIFCLKYKNIYIKKRNIEVDKI